MAPQSRFPIVLITRPEPQATRFAAEIRQHFGACIETVISPLMGPRILPVSAPETKYGSVVYTSETGVLASAHMAENLPKTAYCVGERTAKVARDRGFDAVSAKGDVDDLFQLLQTNPDAAPFLLLQGKDTRGNLVERLRGCGMIADQLIVYEQRPIPLSDAAIAVLGTEGHVVLPVFSPKTAELLVAAMGHIRVSAKISFVAISKACAEKLGQYSSFVRMSESPDLNGVIAEIKPLLGCP